MRTDRDFVVELIFAMAYSGNVWLVLLNLICVFGN